MKEGGQGGNNTRQGAPPSQISLARTLNRSPTGYVNPSNAITPYPHLGMLFFGGILATDSLVCVCVCVCVCACVRACVCVYVRACAMIC